MAVSNALPGLSPGLSHLTYHTAYTPFTPSNSEQRLHPPYYAAAGTELAGASFNGTISLAGYLPVSFFPT